MKTIGIVGGIGPESTILYYRGIVASYRARVPDGSYPSLLINSIDLKEMVDLITAGQLTDVTRVLLDAITGLADGGAKVGLIAANTPHIVFGEVSANSPIPLVSIVESARDAAFDLGLTKVGLLGTRFTMEGQFYPEVFARKDIAIAVPAAEDRAYVHGKYMDELVNGIIRPQTRKELLSIIGRLKESDGIQGIILGGTELPLILKEASYAGIPCLDTARLHVERVVRAAMAQ